ncbi:uncharacterized protein LOC130786095 [Actinidia eriantha]|uniref:uncharacterized protein LOC130786095 n=1 Tax=Actinidia eriantha TaxID=165200 RepID=UPI00258B19B3|nr:uncharacterized protein LOC130786095 [Actinidia eriantha]
MEAAPDKSDGATVDYFAQIPCYYLREAIRALLKCLGLEVLSSQDGGVNEPNPQHLPSTTDGDADPPPESVEDTAATSPRRPSQESQPRPPINNGTGPQTN